MVERSIAGKIHKLIFASTRKDFFLYSLLQLLTIMLNLVNNIIIARKFSVHDYGIYSLCTIVAAATVTFGVNWSSSSLIYFGSKERAETGNINKVFWARTVILLCSILVITIMFIVFESSVNDYLTEKLSAILLAWILVRAVQDYLVHYFLAVKKQLFATLVELSARAALFIFIIVLPFDIKKIIVLCIICDLAALAFIGFAGKKDIGRPEMDRKLFNEILRFSFWQLIGFSGLSIVNFGDAIVIKHFMSIENVGEYNSVYRLFNGVAGLSYTISSFFGASISEYFHKKSTAKLKEFFYKDRYTLLTVITVLHLLVITFSKQIVLFVYGEKYLSSVGIMKILMVGSIFRYFSVFYMLYYNSTGKYSTQQGINLFRAVINISLDIVLVKKFGLMGPAVATTFAALAAFFVSYLNCERSIKQECAA